MYKYHQKPVEAMAKAVAECYLWVKSVKVKTKYE